MQISDSFFDEPAGPSGKAKPAAPSSASYPPRLTRTGKRAIEKAPEDPGQTARAADGLSLTGVMAGLDYTQLASIFGFTRKEVLRRLEHCPKLGYRKHNHPVFEIKVAAPYLCDPVDIETRIRLMSPDDLPQGLQERFYRGLAARRKHAEDGSRLVRVEYVVEMMSDVLALLRTSTQQVIEDEVSAGLLDTETINRLQRKRDAMLADMHARLTTIQDHKQTPTIADDGWDKEPDLADEVEA